MKLRFLHLEDNGDDAELVRSTLAREGFECDILAVDSGPAYLQALQETRFDAVFSDSSVPGYDGNDALVAARERYPDIPFIVVSTAANLRETQQASPPLPVSARVAKSEIYRLGDAVRSALSVPAPDATTALNAVFVPQPDTTLAPDAAGGPGAVPASDAASTAEPVIPGGSASSTSQSHNMRQLVSVIQKLSMTRDLQGIMDIVRRAARQLVNADGATFVLRDGDRCFYAEEDAIGPLWKGQRFPMTACISGWAMLNREPAAIEDIYLDSRIPHDAYRPTFVKSLVMTPIRTVAPIGAIGVYWAYRHRATPEEIELLQALADSTSIAIEAADLFANLERRVAERTAEVDRRNTELEVLNKELEAFSYSVAHDLRSPLITIDGFAQVLAENIAGTVDEANRQHLERISIGVRRMHRLINDLLSLSKIVRAPLNADTVDLSKIAREILHGLRDGSPSRVTAFNIADDVVVQGDPGLLRIVLENLLSNAWKFTSRQERTQIDFGAATDHSGQVIHVVRDNGAGFDPRYASKLFSPFQRLHTQTQFAGTGIGLATVQRIIHRHGGRIWAESTVNAGAAFYFTLPPK